MEIICLDFLVGPIAIVSGKDMRMLRIVVFLFSVQYFSIDLSSKVVKFQKYHSP